LDRAQYQRVALRRKEIAVRRGDLVDLSGEEDGGSAKALAGVENFPLSDEQATLRDEHLTPCDHDQGAHDGYHEQLDERESRTVVS